MAEEQTDDIHPDLKQVADTLDGGDIEHHCVQIALDKLFENWTALRADPGFADDREGLAEEFMDQFDRTVACLSAMRPQVAAAVEAVLSPDRKGP